MSERHTCHMGLLKPTRDEHRVKCTLHVMSTVSSRFDVRVGGADRHGYCCLNDCAASLGMSRRARPVSG